VDVWVPVFAGTVAESIRPWGINCTESNQAFGTGAKQFTGDHTLGQTVIVRVKDIDDIFFLTSRVPPVLRGW
jgi:hypothetical protein